MLHWVMENLRWQRSSSSDLSLECFVKGGATTYSYRHPPEGREHTFITYRHNSHTLHHRHHFLEKGNDLLRYTTHRLPRMGAPSKDLAASRQKDLADLFGQILRQRWPRRQQSPRKRPQVSRASVNDITGCWLGKAADRTERSGGEQDVDCRKEEACHEVDKTMCSSFTA